jgi:hypothetical protein
MPAAMRLNSIVVVSLIATTTACALLQGCSSPDPTQLRRARPAGSENTGEANVGVSTSALSNAADVVTAVVEVRNSANALVKTINLTQQPDTWRGELLGLPLGALTIGAKLSDAGGVVLYSTPEPVEVTIQAGVTANVTLIASSQSQSFGNYIPNITSLAVDRDPMRRGDVVTFTASAGDLDKDPLTYSWQINSKPVDPNASANAANDAQRQAEIAEFEANVKPTLTTTCGGCHTGNPAVGPSYLVAPMRDTLIAFASGSLVGTTPETSRVYIKGAHTGPALTAAQKPIIYKWIVDYNAAKALGAKASGASTLTWAIPADTADTRISVLLTVTDNKGGEQSFGRIFDFEIPSANVSLQLNNGPVIGSFTSSVGYVGPGSAVHGLTLSATDPDVGDTLTVTSGAPGADSYPDCPGTFGAWTSTPIAGGSQFKTTFAVSAATDFAALALYGYCSVRARVTDSKGVAGTALLRVPVRAL